MVSLGLHYTVKEKVELVVARAEMNGKCRLAAQLYSSRNPGRPIPAHGTISSLYKSFLETGSVCRRRRRKGIIVDGDFEIAVLAYVTVNPQVTTRQIARDSDVHHIRESSNDASRAVRHPMDNNRKVFIAFDHCHILRNLRNKLLYANRGLCNHGQYYSRKYLRMLLDITEEQSSFKPFRYLTRKHVYPTNFGKMSSPRESQYMKI
ncbi:hypothetical protein MTO96_039321 [Rhipicephalus appendiculatus]